MCGRRRSKWRPTIPPSCAIRTPFSTMCWLATGNPQSHKSSRKVKMHTTPSRQFHHTAHTRAHLISCVGRAIAHHSHTHFTPCWLFLGTTVHTISGVVYLINCHDLTFDLLRRPLRHLAGSKVTLDRGHAHLSPCPRPHK